MMLYIGGTLFNLELSIVVLSTLTSGAFHNANGGLVDVVVGRAFLEGLKARFTVQAECEPCMGAAGQVLVASE